MTYSIRHQVFLSSTFTDLKEERAEVIQALWELDCIPTGMEAFLASNASQWEIIQNVIDQCDYYVLIIGGRYGSLTTDGISYTEREYNYARLCKMPVLAFVHASPEEIPQGKAEKETEARQKLESFRSRVMAEYPVRGWTTAHQLGSLVSRSLIQEIKRTPRPGWIRNDGGSPVALLERIDALTQENVALKEKSRRELPSAVAVEELSGGEDEVTLTGSVNRYDPAAFIDNGSAVHWSSVGTWDMIFRRIGPKLLNEATDQELRESLSIFYGLDPDLPRGKAKYRNSQIYDTTFADVIIQLRALGLIDKGIKKRGVNDKSSYWRLTDYGDRYLVGLLAKRKATTTTPAIPDDNESEV